MLPSEFDSSCAKRKTKQNRTKEQRSIVFELFVSLPLSLSCPEPVLASDPAPFAHTNRGKKEQLKDSFSIEARSFFTSSSDFS